MNSRDIMSGVTKEELESRPSKTHYILCARASFKAYKACLGQVFFVTSYYTRLFKVQAL